MNALNRAGGDETVNALPQRSVFRLATMTTDMRTYTAVVLGLPILSFVMARGVLLAQGVAAIMPILFLGVWLFLRPSRFVIDVDSLRIEWPLRARRIARSSVLEARIISGQELRQTHGRGMRIGAGGLWGSFGLLATPDQTFSMWISRTDRFVLVSSSGARPLLITPDHPEAFVSALRAKS